MKRVHLLPLLFLTFLGLLIPHSNADEFHPVVQAQREIYIMRGGLNVINDTFSFKAPFDETITISEVKIGLASTFKPERLYFQLWKEDHWESLEFEEYDINSSIKEYHIELPYPILLVEDSELRVRASYLFTDLSSWNIGEISLTIPLYPLIGYSLSSFTLNATLPEAAVLRNVEPSSGFINSTDKGVWLLGYYAENLGPWNNENFTITYSPSPEERTFLNCELLKQRISIHSNSLKMESTYVFINKGDTLRSFDIELPKFASKIRVRDSVGTLNVYYNPENGENPIQVRISPRTPVFRGDKWTTIVEYSIPKEEFIEDNGHFTYLFPISDFPYYIRRLVMSLTLQEGGEFITSEPDPISVQKESTFQKEVIFELGSVVPSESIEVKIEYQRSIIWTLFRPVIWILIAAGVFSLVFLLHRKGYVEEEPLRIEEKEIEVFLKLYRERLTLMQEIETLQNRVEKREINRDQYQSRSAEINRRQHELLRSLRRIGNKLELFDDRIGEKIREIRSIEDAIQRNDDTLRNLDLRLRTRRISRRDYQHRKRDHLSKRRQYRTRIEQALSNIQA